MSIRFTVLIVQRFNLYVIQQMFYHLHKFYLCKRDEISRQVMALEPSPLCVGFEGIKQFKINRQA